MGVGERKEGVNWMCRGKKCNMVVERIMVCRMCWCVVVILLYFSPPDPLGLENVIMRGVNGLLFPHIIPIVIDFFISL